MHGRLKVKSTVEIEKEKSNEKKKKLMYYKKIISDIQNMDINLEYLDELLKLTSEVLRMNPDYYTFWNIRKKLFQKLKAESKTECEALMIKELNFLNECLKLNPKSYSVWHHRCFITEFMDRADWPLELELTSKFLECDNRNFHCWDYRRFVFSKCTTSPESELLFSTKKISMDFSNFSSWHYRSKLISQIHPNLFVDHMDVISREYSLVENAIFTDPSDQSGWFYLKWLIDKKAENIFLKSLLLDVKKKFFVVLFSSPIKQLDGCVFIKEEKVVLNWKPISNRKFNLIFYAELNQISTASSSCFHVQLNSSVFHRGVIDVQCSVHDSDFSLIQPPADASEGNEIVQSSTKQLLQNQLTSLEGLQEIESDNKFTLLTLVKIMTKLDLIQFYGDILKKISKLIILDPARKLYYLDLESKLKIEKCLKEKKTSMRSVDLSNLALTTLSHADEMFWFKSINLSNNNLTELSNGHYLYCIELLILNNNRIKSCDKLYNLKQLAILDLSNNCISCVDDLRTLSSCPKLQTLFLKNNPIALTPDYESLVKNILPQVKFFN